MIISYLNSNIMSRIKGAAAAAATTPLDVVKTVLQTRGAGSDSSVRNAQGVKDVCDIILKRYGWRGFLMGISPRVFSHMPSTAICWTTVRKDGNLSHINFR
jgi:solute carrier family 25 iron transporter 28/37